MSLLVSNLPFFLLSSSVVCAGVFNIMTLGSLSKFDEQKERFLAFLRLNNSILH